MRKLILLIFLYSQVLSAPVNAADICDQSNLNLLIETYPAINTLVERHQQEQEKLEKKIEHQSGLSETSLDETLQTEKNVSELDALVTKAYREMAERQYAEFWELCTELTEQ